ncbi:MAG: hypothetical protein AAF602_12065 [Myxococcota bacterium]
MREPEAELERESALALAFLDDYDPRAVLGVMGPLHHVTLRVGSDPNQLFEWAAERSGPRGSTQFRSYLKRDRKGLEVWDLTEIDSRRGPGFAHDAKLPWRPTVPLARAIADVTYLVRADARYARVKPWLARGLPIVDDPPAFPRAVGAILGDRIPGDQASILLDKLWVWVGEARSKSHAIEIAESVRHTRGTARLTVVHERLFALVVARGTDTKPVETDASLRRFEEGLRAALERAL